MIRNYKQLFEVLPRHRRVYDSWSHRLPHYVYARADTEAIHYQHRPPQTLRDRLAFAFMKTLRATYDYLSSYDPEAMSEEKWINRCILLETVAGVPGMVGGMARHLRSLRTMQRDNGWIHHLIEEADNERFHLMVFLNLRSPSLAQKALVISLQGAFFFGYFATYLLQPKYCHRFVGYLEEEAIKTYSAMLKVIDTPTSSLHHWARLPAPVEAAEYYHLGAEAKFRDVILSIRADEACHRETNHFLADVDPTFNIAEEKTDLYDSPQLKKV